MCGGVGLALVASRPAALSSATIAASTNGRCDTRYLAIHHEVQPAFAAVSVMRPFHALNNFAVIRNFPVSSSPALLGDGSDSLARILRTQKPWAVTAGFSSASHENEQQVRIRARSAQRPCDGMPRTLNAGGEEHAKLARQPFVGQRRARVRVSQAQQQRRYAAVLRAWLATRLDLLKRR